MDERIIAFGPFRLLAERRLLLEGETPVRLGSRAMDILLAVSEQPGEVISKAEIAARVWPGAIVEDATLRVHVAALRRVLGDGQNGRRYLVNVPGRGYSFVAPLHMPEGGPPPAPAAVRPSSADPNLPTLLIRVVGRDEAIDALCSDVEAFRLVSIVGPGGIGKTTVALAAAHQVRDRYRDGARFVDLAPLSDAAMVPRALALAVGMPETSEDPLQRLLAFLRDRQMLIILDSCEHVVATAAALAEDVLRSARDVHIVATTREPLRAEGERVHRLAPLKVPDDAAALSPDQALSYSAVSLFVERAAAGADGFDLKPEDVPAVADICRRLDGIALAIELAAGRIDTLGVREIASLLDNQLRLLSRGRRTALPRHQTLRAALDWSFDLLAPGEQTILRRLGVFAGWFTAEAALTVVGNDSPPAGLEDLAGLVAKSLLAADVTGPNAFYRLLDTTRAYAREKLAEAGEETAAAQRHADYYCRLLERADADWQAIPGKAQLDDYARQLDNVRVALDWCFGPGGDAALGLELTAAAVPLWKHLSLMEECRTRVNQALAARRGDGDGTAREMQLFAALGATLLSTISSSGAEIAEAWTSTLAIAEAQGDVDYQLRALWGLWLGGYHTARHREALALAERFRLVAATHRRPADALVGDRMKGVSLLLLGQLAEARQLIGGAVDGYRADARGSDILRFQFDQSVTARTVYCQVLWLQGLPDQAMRLARDVLEEANGLGHGLSICDSLAQGACPIALRVGALDEAEGFVATLIERARRDDLHMWEAWGRCFRGILLSQRGELRAGVEVMREALADLPPRRYVPRHLGLIGDLANCECRAGLLDDGLATIDAALHRAVATEEVWCLADLHRIKGDLLLEQASEPDAATAEYRRSMEIAAAQGALALELRAATSLAVLLRGGRDREAARAVLAPVYGRLTEGLERPAALEAEAVLATLG